MRVTEAAATIADLLAMAQQRLPRAVFDFINGGADEEVTLRWNVGDFDEIEWHPRVLVDVSKRDYSAVILKEKAGLPLIVAPTGLAALAWPRADVLLAQAAQACDIPFTISTSSSVRMEEIRSGAKDARLWFQLYLYKDRDLVRSLIDRARTIGCEALVVTVDVPLLGRRLRDRRNRFTVPLRPTVRLLWDILRCPHWTAQILLQGVPRMQNFIDGGTHQQSVASLAALMAANMDASVSWDSLAWLRDHWQGCLVVKGILRAPDALHAINCGVDAIVVSNHGGRQLDCAVSSVSALPSIVSTVAGQAEVFLDSGIRRGADIVKARALGAQAVMVGRAALFGVAVAGRAGADHALGILKDEIDRCLGLIGCPSLARIDSSWIGKRA